MMFRSLLPALAHAKWENHEHRQQNPYIYNIYIYILYAILYNVVFQILFLVMFYWNSKKVPYFMPN